MLTERTRLVAVTGASNLIGTRPPVAEIAALVHDAGALLAVDGVHLTAHAPVDVRALGADFFTCSPYKFLGPHCGVLAAAPALLETLRPAKLLPSTRRRARAVRARHAALRADGRDDRGGRLPRRARAGADRDRGASGWSPRCAPLEEHEDELRERLEAGLARAARRPAVVAGRPRGRPTLLLTFDGRDAADAYRFLAERGVNAPAGSFYAIEASRWLGLGDTGGLRVGLAPYTDRDDVDRLLDRPAGVALGPLTLGQGMPSPGTWPAGRQRTADDRTHLAGGGSRS